MLWRRKLTYLLIVLCLSANAGCAGGPYRYGRFRPESETAPPLVVERGGQHPTLDRIEHTLQWPARVLPFGPRPKSRELSPETEEKLTTYLEKNDLNDVYVAVRQYDPADQWRRLKANDRMAPGWRYSAGSLSLIGYTMLPGRVFGSNRYNPYTNTLYVNSDAAVGVLYAAANAKDVHSRKLPGTYATVNALPLLSLGRQARAAGDVIAYTRAESDWETEREAYHVLYPEIAAGTARMGSPFLPFFAGPLLGMGGSVVGHAAGRTMAARREKERQIEDPDPAPDSARSQIQLAGHEEDKED